MSTEPKPPHPASNPEVRYEKSDATVRPLYQFLFWISVITILTAILAGGILRGLESWRARASTRPRMAQPQDTQQAPAPRLQIREPMDLAAFRKQEAEFLSTYGVVDREKGIYHIPIDEAMKLTLERGLPVVGDAVPSLTPLPGPAAEAPAAKAPAKGARP